MQIEQRMDADMIWSDTIPEKEPTHLIVYHMEEHGYATALAGAGLCGDNEPIAKIYSKLQTNPALNYIPEPYWPEYRLYETRTRDDNRVFILRVPRVYPVNISTQEQANPNVWLYTYPIVRDIVLMLNQYGVNRLTYMTTNVFNFHPEFRDYAKIEHGHVIKYNFLEFADEVTKYYGDLEMEQKALDYVIAPNVWIWCDVFGSFCTNAPMCSEILMGPASQTMLDTDTADTLLNHFSTNYGVDYDEDSLLNLTVKLTSLNNNSFVSIDLEDESHFDFGEEGFEGL